MLEGRERWLYAFLAQLLRDAGDAPARRFLDAASRDVRGRIARVLRCTGTAWRRRSPILRTAPASALIVWWTRAFEEVRQR